MIQHPVRSGDPQLKSEVELKEFVWGSITSPGAPVRGGAKLGYPKTENSTDLGDFLEEPKFTLKIDIFKK